MVTVTAVDGGSCVVPADAVSASAGPQLCVLQSAPFPDAMYSDLPTTALSAGVAVLLIRMVDPQETVTANPLEPPS